MSQVLINNKTANASNWQRWLIVSVPLLLVAAQWLTYERVTDELIYDVPQVAQIAALETTWLYAYLHFFSFIPVFLLSFDRRVHYYTSWRYLMPAIALVGAFFIIWDVIFTEMNVWNFNEAYFLGVRFLHLPIEEWFFFFTIPFCCVFIYECLNHYVKKDLLAPYESYISQALIILFFVGGFLSWGKIYTSSTLLLTGGFVLYHFICLPKQYRARFYFAYLVIIIPFLIVDGVLTGGYTNAPIVLYNPAEFTNIRIGSVPFEDGVYGFLLLMGIVTLLERFRRKV